MKLQQSPIVFTNKRVATDNEMEIYSYGKCMWFALAFHDLTNFSIEAIIEKDGAISHSWVKTSDSHNLDIVGLDGADDFIQFNPDNIQTFSRDKFIALLGGENLEELHNATQLILSMYDFSPNLTLKNNTKTAKKMKI